MNQQRFEKKNTANHIKALCFTLIFHFAIIGSAYYGASGGEVNDILPDFIKSYFEEPAEEPDKDASKKIDRA